MRAVAMRALAVAMLGVLVAVPIVNSVSGAKAVQHGPLTCSDSTGRSFFVPAYKVGFRGYPSPAAAVNAFVRSNRTKLHLPPGPWYGTSLSINGAPPASVSVRNGDVTIVVSSVNRGRYEVSSVSC